MKRIEWIATGYFDLVSQFLPVTDRNGYLSLQYNSGAEYGQVEVYIGKIFDLSRLPVRPYEAHIPSVTVEGDTQAQNTKCNWVGVSPSESIVIYITYVNRVLGDTAFGLYRALLRLGHKHVYLMGDFNMTMYHELASLAHDLSFPNGTTLQTSETTIPLLQIIIGPHEPQLLSRFYVSFQLEQPWSVFVGEVFRKTLVDSSSIWVLSQAHKDVFATMFNIPIHKIFVVPLFTHSIEYNTTWRDAVLAVSTNEYFDIKFMGSCSARRGPILAYLESRCVEEAISCQLQCTGNWSDIYLAEERDVHMLTTKVVINIHHSDTSSLEQHRVLYLLSLGVIVVSERSKVDPQLDNEYESSGAVLFRDSIDEIFDMAVFLSRNATMRDSLKLKAIDKYKEVESNLDQLKYAVNRVKEILQI